MNRRNFIITILLLFFVFASLSCDNGSATNAEPNNLVKVSLVVSNEISQKSVSLYDNINWASFTFQYNAVPQWIGSNIQGTADWTNIAYSNENLNIGYFSPGQWIFGVRILNNGIPVYEGFSEKINVSNSSVLATVFMRKLTTVAKTGSISISISAPTINDDYLSISCNSGEPVLANPTRSKGTTTFEYNIEDLSSGAYTITLNHPQGGSGTMIAVDLVEGQMAVISGHLDNGIWQIGYIVINVYTVSINKNAYGNVYLNTNTAPTGDRVSFEAIPLSGSSVQSLTINYTDENEIIHSVDYTNVGNLYSFYMPNYDVIINITFRVVDNEINVAYFKSIVQGIYDANEATSFGRSDTPPESDYFAVKDVQVWLEGTKISWYSPNGNTFKFKAGSLKNFFKDCDKLVSIDLRGIDTSDITSMASLFENCYDLKSVNFEGINTAKVVDMSKMFYHAGYHYFPVYETGTPREDQTHNHQDNSENLIISNMNFNTGKVLNMSYMFSVCAVVDLSGTNMSSWDVSKCTDFSYMFAGESINKSGYKYWYNKIAAFNISNWNTISATTFRNMFALCNRFTEIDISGFKFDNVLYVDRMFERCECLGRVATQGNPEDNIKVIFPTITKLTKVEDMLYWFGKDVEFRRENMKAIVESWDFTGNPNADALFANNANNDTSPETIPSNRIFSSECCSNTSANYRQNFRTQISATTLDGRTLYFGGSGVKGQRIRSIE